MILMTKEEINARLKAGEDPIDLEIELWLRVKSKPVRHVFCKDRPLCTVYMEDENETSAACHSCPYFRSFEYSCLTEQFGDGWWWQTEPTSKAAELMISALETCRNEEALVCPKCGEMIDYFGTDPDIVNNPVEIMFNHGNIYADCPSCGEPFLVTTHVLSVEAMPL